MKLAIKKLIPDKVRQKAVEKAPLLWFGAGIIGVGAAMISVAMETPKALEEYEKVKEEIEEEETEETTKVQHVVKVVKKVVTRVVPRYKKSIIFAICAIVCLSRSYSIHEKRIATATALYQISEEKRQQFEKHAREVMKPEQIKEVEHNIAQETIDTHPADLSNIPGEGNLLCYNTYGGGYFWSTFEDLHDAIFEINSRLPLEHFIPLSDFFWEIDIPELAKTNNGYGWHIDNGMVKLKEGKNNVGDYKGEPVYILDFVTEPRFDFAWS